MQMRLPFFPTETKYINSGVGVFSQDGYVYYLVNGSPIFCHEQDNLESLRFIIGNLVENNLCTTGEINCFLGISKRNINRYAKKFRECGGNGFFNKEDNRGKCYRMTESKLEEAQKLLDQGLSQVKVAKELGVNEASIRYHLKKGNLKKKPPKKVPPVY